MKWILSGILSALYRKKGTLSYIEDEAVSNNVTVRRLNIIDGVKIVIDELCNIEFLKSMISVNKLLEIDILFFFNSTIEKHLNPIRLLHYRHTFLQFPLIDPPQLHPKIKYDIELQV